MKYIQQQVKKFAGKLFGKLPASVMVRFRIQQSKYIIPNILFQSLVVRGNTKPKFIRF